MAYNGWRNYETWAIKLWADNDEGSYTFLNEKSDEIVSEHGNSGESRRVMADYLKESYEEGKENVLAESYQASVWSDLLGAALDSVDWYEIADHYITDAAERSES